MVFLNETSSRKDIQKRLSSVYIIIFVVCDIAGLAQLVSEKPYPDLTGVGTDQVAGRALH